MNLLLKMFGVFYVYLLQTYTNMPGKPGILMVVFRM
tara:strand:- start:9 stop:116 length:108 start_codon:yes stop_codon:yes gene_type:complete